MVELPSFYEEVGALILKARRGRLTQDQLAERVALTRTSITNIEKGRQRLMLHTLAQIAEALGVAVTDLLPQAAAAATKDLSKALKSRSKGERVWINAAVKAVKKGDAG